MFKRNKKSSIIMMLAAVLLLLPLSGSAQAISRNKKPATTKTTNKKSATSNTTTTKSKQSSSSKHSNGSTRAQNIPAVVQKAMDDMVWVEGGTFTMGATSEQANDADNNEKPAHQVTLSGYYISRYEVTQDLWQTVMGYNPSHFTSDLRNPVEMVTWQDCQEFITKLNKLTGKTFRLPTEAEWEFAARGGKLSHGYKYAGSNDLSNVAWYIDNSGRMTHPVGTKSPNELGLYDMCGNVWEWCQDWYDESYRNTPQSDPSGPLSGYDRVIRGGDFIFSAEICRVSTRYHSTPNELPRIPLCLGLRLAAGSSNRSNLSNQSSNMTKAQKDRIIQQAISDMVFVESGTFTMGATSEQGEDASSDEKPVHKVTLSSFYIGKYEVTQELWHAVMGDNPSHFQGNLNHPVERISRQDCLEFIKKLNKLTGKTFRLPTEAEWEFAARGGNQGHGYKYAGSNTPGNVAWYEDNSDDMTHPVGQKSSNELGLFDMSGNVSEWCQDWYEGYTNSSQTNPTGPSSGSMPIMRGGGGDNRANSCRVSSRNASFDPVLIDNFTGMRLAASSL